MGPFEWVAFAGAAWVMLVAGALVLVSGAARARRACDAFQAAAGRETAILGVSCDPEGVGAPLLTPEMELDLLRFGLYPPFSDTDR